MSEKNSNSNKDVTQMLTNKTIADLKIAQEGQRRCYSCMESYSEEYDVCPFCGATTDIEVENALHMYPGTVLHEKYVIGKVIGYGGFGVTYLAWDTVLQIKVAIKEYLPSEFSTRAMGQSQVTVFSGDKTIQFADGMGKFLDEAKRLAKFRNESGIVRIFDSFNENGTAYIVMEYLRGETLAERLEREHTIPVEEAIQMLMPIIESLDKVHEEGIIHRDIAPDNIFLTEDGEVKLIDFGAARYATTSRSRSLTVIIKPGYSPEEQYMSRGDQGPHTDVYSVGACLYRMVTGEVPPDAMERHATFEKSHRDMLKPIRKYVKDIDERRENAIYNALNVRIVDRTPDMVSLAGELLSEEPVKRRKSGIRKIDPLTWPLWAKVGIPASLALVVTLSILLATGVVGPRSNLKSGIVLGLSETFVPNIVGTDIESAGKKLEKNELNYQIGDRMVSKTIGRDLILQQNPDAFNVVAKGTTVEIKKSDGLGDETVPNVVGKNIEIARQMMEGLEFKIEFVEQPDDIIAINHIVSQSVAEGTLHKREIPITLVVSTGKAGIDKTKTVEIPDLVGKSYDEAKSILENLNLSVSMDYAYNAEIPVDQIVGQIPLGGEKGKQGDVVNLTINKGQEMVTVIDVREKNLDTALALLADLGLDVYTNSEENDLYKSGTVFKQSLEPNTKVKPGTKITITYSSGKSVSVPDVTGMKIKNAENLLVGAGLTISAEYEPSNNVGKDVVIRQTPAKGTSAQKGDAVVLVVSSGVNGGTGKSAKNNRDKNGKGEGGSEEGSNGKDSKSAVLVSLMLDSKPAKIIYTVGETLDTEGLRIVASYSDGSKKDVTKSCSFSESVLTTTGGHSVIATYKEGTVTKTTSFTVTVNAINAKFDESAVTVKVGSKVSPTLLDVPSSAKVTWESKSQQVAKVSNSGEITGVKVGQTSVTATITVGKSSSKATCLVYVVEQDIEADRVTLDTDTLTICEGNERELVATITPSTVTNTDLQWSTSNNKVAKVSNGKVTGIGEGTCTIPVS
ncbi:MAG: PASTA domain-containing protein, partial [Clostridia bacterium]|nr:PASTA domain-containing protein [Clostridia bacterium]